MASKQLLYLSFQRTVLSNKKKVIVFLMATIILTETLKSATFLRSCVVMKRSLITSLASSNLNYSDLKYSDFNCGSFKALSYYLCFLGGFFGVVFFFNFCCFFHLCSSFYFLIWMFILWQLIFWTESFTWNLLNGSLLFSFIWLALIKIVHAYI